MLEPNVTAQADPPLLLTTVVALTGMLPPHLTDVGSAVPCEDVECSVVD